MSTILMLVGLNAVAWCWRAPLKLMRKAPLKRNAPLQRRTPLERRVPPRAPRRAISPATRAQRALMRGQSCLVCGSEGVEPAHLIDRSLAPSAGDHHLAVVPLCRQHHRLYDDHELDLLPHLEAGARYREHVAQAVNAVGLLKALRRITGETWIVDDC